MFQGEKQIELAKDLANCRMYKGYVGDIACGIKLAAENGLSGEIYNLASQEALTELEWCQQIAKLIEWEGDIVTSQASPPLAGYNLNQDLVVDTAKYGSS
jgi:nucleoside-diphosphate-sugar epimerase